MTTQCNSKCHNVFIRASQLTNLVITTLFWGKYNWVTGTFNFMLTFQKFWKTNLIQSQIQSFRKYDHPIPNPYQRGKTWGRYNNSFSSLLTVFIVNIDLHVVNMWQVGYLKALDIWVASCFVFLAVAVSEVLIMFVLGKRARDDATQDQFELMVRTLCSDIT